MKRLVLPLGLFLITVLTVGIYVANYAAQHPDPVPTPAKTPPAFSGAEMIIKPKPRSVLIKKVADGHDQQAETNQPGPQPSADE